MAAVSGAALSSTCEDDNVEQTSSIGHHYPPGAAGGRFVTPTLRTIGRPPPLQRAIYEANSRLCCGTEGAKQCGKVNVRITESPIVTDTVVQNAPKVTSRTWRNAQINYRGTTAE